MTGAGFGVTLASVATGPYAPVIIGFGIIGEIEECYEGYFAVCIKNPGQSVRPSMCCDYNWEKLCYLKWQEVIDAILKRFPDSRFAREYIADQAAIEANMTAHEILNIVEETNKIVKQTDQRLIITQHTVNATFVLVNGTYRIVKETLQTVKERNAWYVGDDGCCPDGYRKICCETTTSTTTSTTTTTTTTDEKLTCRKAVWELYPGGIKKNETMLDVFCGPADRHCYVLNCTIVLGSPAVDGQFFGYRAEWGCIKSKKFFLANFNKSEGWKGKIFVGSTCTPFFGAKNSDMSNHNIEVPIFNTDAFSSFWCKGGHFWKNNYQNKVTVCQTHEHYCYALNCTVALTAGQKGVMEPENYVLTKWGCTDKKSVGIDLNETEAKRLIGKNDALRYQSHVCSRQFGKANVSMSNARIEVLTPPKSCKKAYFSKKLGYNDSFAMSCGQSEHYCYVLNCSSSVKGNKQAKVMTEWGCTDSPYTTEDFRQGKGRKWAEAYLGPIAKDSTCLSVAGTSSNGGIMIPVIGGKRLPPKDNCLGDHGCYVLYCEDPAKRIKEWGCMPNSNAHEICHQKFAEFGYDVPEAKKKCLCYTGVSNKEIRFEANEVKPHGMKRQPPFEPVTKRSMGK
uniref:Envelopment polyprotein n=1 Tax=Globodera pallida TaxID=36090 RepID=A0A183CLP7_GLOPA